MTTFVNAAPRLLVSNTRNFMTKNRINLKSPLLCRTNLLYRSTKIISRRVISTSCIASGSAARAETTSTTQGLSKLQAEELVLRLTSEERNILINALQEYQSKLIKDEYEGKIAFETHVVCLKKPWCVILCCCIMTSCLFC